MKMKILHLQNPSRLVASGKTQKLVPEMITEAMDKIHQLTMNMPQTKPEKENKITNPKKVNQINVGAVRDLETHLGRAVIHRDCQESNNLAQVGILIANYKRSLNHLYRNVAKKCVERKGQDIVKSIMPNDIENWQKTSTKKAIETWKGVDNFFKAVADSYQIPIMVAHGLSKQRLIREEQKPFLETTKLKIYGADYLQEKQTDYACLGFKESSQETYQFRITNKLYGRDLIRNNQGESIKELTLSDAIKGIQEIAAADNDKKEKTDLSAVTSPIFKLKLG